MLSVHAIDGYAYVRVACDACLEPIDRPNTGVYAFREHRLGEAFVTLHKEGCLQRWLDAHTGDDAYDAHADLELLPIMLAATMGRGWPAEVIEAFHDLVCIAQEIA